MQFIYSFMMVGLLLPILINGVDSVTKVKDKVYQHSTTYTRGDLSCTLTPDDKKADRIDDIKFICECTTGGVTKTGTWHISGATDKKTGSFAENKKQFDALKEAYDRQQSTQTH